MSTAIRPIPFVDANQKTIQASKIIAMERSTDPEVIERSHPELPATYMVTYLIEGSDEQHTAWVDQTYYSRLFPALMASINKEADALG